MGVRRELSGGMEGGKKSNKRKLRKSKRKAKLIVSLGQVEDAEGPVEDEEDEGRATVTMLMSKCDLTEDQVMQAYTDFNENNPDGIITKEQFLQTMEDKLIAESLFRVFDEDNSGGLNFSEYLQVKSVKTIETPEEKLNWIFTAYDEDGGGSIDEAEIKEIVLGCFRMAGIDEDDELLPSCVEDVRESIDVDGDGDISKEEFVKNALKNKFIAKLLKYDNKGGK